MNTNRQSPEVRLLKMLYKDEHKGLLYQKPSICPVCSKKFDPFDENIRVEFREVIACGRELNLLDGYCPTCGTLVRAAYEIEQ